MECFTVERSHRNTRATPRSARSGGSSGSNGKGCRVVWLIRGPWDLVPRHENTGTAYTRKADAIEKMDRLNNTLGVD